MSHRVTRRAVVQGSTALGVAAALGSVPSAMAQEKTQIRLGTEDIKPLSIPSTIQPER